MPRAPAGVRGARSERRTGAGSPRSPSVAAFLVWGGAGGPVDARSWDGVGADRGPMSAAFERGASMRHEPVALAQLGFLLDAGLRDLVAEQPGADLEATEAVLEPVDGERLGGTASADHRVYPGAGPRDEPEATAHAV